jgi:hypothetical protein
MGLLVLACVVALSLALAVAGAGGLLWSLLSIMNLMQRDSGATPAGSLTIEDTPLAKRLAA